MYTGGSDLLVGHTAKSLDSERTLQSLYLNPMMRILEFQNENQQNELNNTAVPAVGVFETSPNTTLVLLLDFKSNGSEAWPTVIEQLEPFRRNHWLTSWNSTLNQVTPGPVTVVASGDISFETVTQNNDTYRDIFLDAPLGDLSDPKYNISNSFYASMELSKAIGTMWFGRFNSQQLDTIREQIKGAKNKGLIEVTILGNY